MAYLKRITTWLLLLSVITLGSAISAKTALGGYQANFNTVMGEIAYNPLNGLGNYLDSSCTALGFCNGADTNLQINGSQVGERVGSGGVKDVHAFGDDQVVAFVQPGKNVDSLTTELSTLNQLDELGFPTVNARLVDVDGQPALLMDRFAQGSKDIVRTVNGRPRVVGESNLLNQRSIDDLKNIRQGLQDSNVSVDDLQFLIGRDGRVVIADPIAVRTGTSPSRNNLRTIDRLIEAAMRNQ